MKVQQAQKAHLVISGFISLLLVYTSCKTTKNQADEAYNIAREAIKRVSKQYLSENLVKNYDTIILLEKVYKYDKESFKATIDKWQETNKLTMVRSFKNECADTIFKQFDFKDKANDKKIIKHWNIKAINNTKVINKSKLQFRDNRLKLSNPIFNKEFTKALILVNYKAEGKVIYYFSKENNKWKFVCEVYDIFYHG